MIASDALFNLAALRLLLGRHLIASAQAAASPSVRFDWACGCRARGRDEDGLAWIACDRHRDDFPMTHA